MDAEGQWTKISCEKSGHNGTAQQQLMIKIATGWSLSTCTRSATNSKNSMLKHLLPISLGLTCALSYGQGNVVVQVTSPSSIAGNYANAYAVASSGWGVADLLLPENAVQDDLVLGFDGTTADSLGCESLVNAAEVAGKIAVIYRGTCNFSLKALNAQTAGARAVLLISNGDALNINMQGGDYGAEVTIPVVMIGQTNGAAIRAVMDQETVNAFIGNNYGAFPTNLSMDVYDYIVPPAAAYPTILAGGSSEYSAVLGGFIHNFGSEAQSSARLRAVVTQDGTEVYNEVGEALNLVPGDSALIVLPAFTQSAYSGEYIVTYTAETDLPDDFDADNTQTASLYFGDLVSYAPVDAASGLPTGEVRVVPSGFGSGFRTCLTFADPNASRMVVTGLHFTGSTPTDVAAPVDTSLIGMDAYAYAFQWVDLITDASARPTDVGLISMTNGNATYSYTSDLQNEPIFIPFPSPLTLVDNERYLFCVETTDSLVRHGWNDQLDYALTGDQTGVPTTLIYAQSVWYNGFTNLAGSPSLAVKTMDVNIIGIREEGQVELTPYPNPTTDLLRIPMRGLSGAAVLRIYGIDGSLVSEQKMGITANEVMTVDVSTLSAGTYMFHVDLENGKRSDFRVVVAK